MNNEPTPFYAIANRENKLLTPMTKIVPGTVFEAKIVN